MTRKKNLCHSAPTGKKCARQDKGDKCVTESQEGTVSKGLQAFPPVKPKKADDADHLTRAADRGESVTEMRTMMAKVLKALGVKERGEDLTDSPVEVSSDEEFID